MKRTISGWILAVVILLSAWSAAGVFAYFTGGDRITNRFGVGYNDVEIREEFPDPDPEDEEITKKVSFVNAVEGQGLENAAFDLEISAYGIQTTDLDGGRETPAQVWGILSNQKELPETYQ